ncbi:OpgC family protein [Sulfitobacter guttiformis]|uniref:OpgC protein n=1 Tax=Sulfitobacter guttiformis TaxID=74349 RepID=A0A420DU66_9RHOB|nr:OpgC domain-containing protein [Sulfitobacter guttiformis]KIN71419.1 Membrane protein [Sulfitobacter guttiformis KCTC 32187]RKE97864.1 hypothetical protein C8N30_2493 [Sulfitobacter guttiformis]
MTTLATNVPISSSPSAAVRAATPPVRDLRLDFFRGIAMFIILMSHTPGNFLISWIPARWGFSDATEMFVFCSGMASAIAFGGTFVRLGWLVGTARVAFRVWQIYWAHIALFIALATFLAGVDYIGGYDKRYIASLNLWAFFEDPSVPLLGLLTLTYVPNYFDILPMYMVVLAMMPLVIALQRVNTGLVFVFMIVVWVGAQRSLWGSAQLSLPAEPWSNRQWFFNPFGWQLIFFTGFALMRGWIPKPPVHIALISVATAVVVANLALSEIAVRSIRLNWFFVTESGNIIREAREAIAPLIDKSDFGLFRYTHFLALAYLAWVIAGHNGDNLLVRGTGLAARTWGVILAFIIKVGQQSLAVFIMSMFLAQVMGLAMDLTSRSTGNTLLINFVGILVLIATAYGAGWFKSQPWKRKS